ncbi:SDR family oxidoreductase [Chloroflexi bacterium TSY]|nr:SDR family oxidoreductase [Chloroflexi bacterium TSY]
MRFKDKVVVITGAGNGIGLSTCTIVASEGGTVVGVDINQKGLDDLVEQIRAVRGKIDTQRSNALVEEEVNQVVEQTRKTYGRIDVLVNAVGGSTVIENPGTSIEDLTLGEWQKLLDFNLTGTFLYCNAVIPIMKQQKAGKIVNLASIAGRGLSSMSSSAYAAAKGGIIALTRKLSLELGPFGITCNAIAPGITLTERIATVWNQKSDAEQKAILANIPLGRLPRAEDQARVICFLASRDADFVSGVTIDVTGGQR